MDSAFCCAVKLVDMLANVKKPKVVNETGILNADITFSSVAK